MLLPLGSTTDALDRGVLGLAKRLALPEDVILHDIVSNSLLSGMQGALVAFPVP